MTRSIRATIGLVFFATLTASTASGQSGSAKEPANGFADPRAVTLLDRVEAKMRSARTIAAVRASTIRRPVDGGAAGWRLVNVWVQRPKKYRVSTVNEDSMAKTAFKADFRVSDGTRRLTKGFYGGPDNVVLERTTDEDIYVWDDDVQTLAGLYLHDDEHPGIGHDWRAHKLTEPTFRWMRHLGRANWNGKPYEVIEWAYDIGNFLPSEQVRYTQKIYVGADTLAWRVVTKTSRGIELEDHFRSLELDPALPDSLFQVTVPPGDSAREWREFTPRFKVGDTLPDFTAPLLVGGDSVSLSSVVAGKKGGALWFWGFR